MNGFIIDDVMFCSLFVQEVKEILHCRRNYVFIRQHAAEEIIYKLLQRAL